ncbi:hypothetical protein AUJ65_00180 [Candidatus Micrarchaeota archaeon CG1_02_51_15]|nr:MAG: hypothetical protein AUJ65_00180 [Candidatus Micrarchaeota archaeon CG1_02_51_15]
MNAVVFGGTGFIGSHLTALLSQNNFTTVVASLNGGPGITRVDVSTRKGFEKLPANAEAVFNMASLIRSHDPFDPRFMEVNAIGAKNVAAYARKIGAQLIHSSSASVYGTPLRLPVKEEESNPESPYAKSKLEGEKLCAEAADDLTILRYSSVFGPGQIKESVLPIFLDKSVRGENLRVTDPQRTQDFVFVGDVVSANLHFLNGRLKGTYNIGSGTETSMQELAKTAIRVSKSGSRLTVDSSSPKSGFRMRLDISKAKKAGFSPKTDLETGLKRTLEGLK